MATLPSNISSLSAAEKFDLLDALWEDLEAHSPTLSAEQAFAKRSPWLVYLAREPRLSHLHGDPRFDALLARVAQDWK